MGTTLSRRNNGVWLGLMALFTGCPALGTTAWAVCETADKPRDAFDDDARGARGLNAKIKCFQDAIAQAAPSERAALSAQLKPYQDTLAMRQKLWAYEGAQAPDLNPTVVCDGAGGMRVALFGHGEEYGKGYATCLWLHEQTHIRDFKAICPNWCQGQTSGTIAPYLDESMPGDVQAYVKSLCPAWATARDYRSWRNASECASYTVQAQCTYALMEKHKGEDDYQSSMRHRMQIAREGHADFARRSNASKPPDACVPLPADSARDGAAQVPMRVDKMCWAACASHFPTPTDALDACNARCGSSGAPPEVLAAAASKGTVDDARATKKIEGGGPPVAPKSKGSTSARPLAP